jgi:ferritin-like metal-binding protein YciE
MASTRDDKGAFIRADRAARIAVEELTGLALQERALTQLLARQAGESPLGGPRERVEAHLRQSREHQRTFDELVDRLRGQRGAGELVWGVLRSGLAAAGGVGANVAQIAIGPLTGLRRAGGEERLLENAGVEGAALANKLVILTAVAEAASHTGDEETASTLASVRDEAQSTWDELLEATPQLMQALVAARSHEGTFDFRTAGEPVR